MCEHRTVVQYDTRHDRTRAAYAAGPSYFCKRKWCGVLLGLLGTETSNIGGAVPGTEPIVFEGTGGVVLERFAPPSMFNRMTTEHYGTDYLSVWSYDDDGQDTLLANEIGTTRDVGALRGTRERFLEVNADGQWRIVVEPLYSDQAAATGMSGTANAISGLFVPSTQEPRPFVFTFEGKSNFIVYAVCEGGSDLGANEIGTGQVEAVIEFEAGPCFWGVEADGSWNFRPK